MTDDIEISGDDTSTALKVLLAELASEGNEVQNVVDESPDPTDTPRGDSDDSPLVKGIDVDTREEPVDKGESDEKTLRETLVFVQENDITESSSFRPRDDNDNKVFPLKGSGQIDSIFVSSDSDTFRVYLELDGDKIIDSVSWNNLESESTELAHIGAYQKTSGEYVVSVSDYTFNEKIDFSISPTEETDFNTIRAEIMVDEYATGEE